MSILATAEWLSYPSWLNAGDNAWQMTAATFVGLMSLPGLAVLYGGVMQKRWSVNSMMLTFVAFCLVLVAWCLWAFKMGFDNPIAHSGGGIFGTKGFLGTALGEPGSVLGHAAEEGQALIPSISTGPPFHFPEASLVYFQFVFAAITPILMLGSVLGRISFKAWIPFVLLWITFVYTVNAFLLWGGGYFAAHGALDYSGGYVIHLAAGISGFVAAAVIGPRLQRDREVDAPNNLLMVAVGAGLLWLGWNGFNGGDSYYAGADASAAVLNTNLCTAVAMLVWIAWDYIFRDKPSLLGLGQRDDHGAGRHHSGSRLRERLRRDHDRGGGVHDRVDVDPLPQPGADVPTCGRHARGDLYARNRRAVRRPAGRAPGRLERGRVHRQGHGATNLPGVVRTACQRQLDAAAMAGRGRPVGDPVQRRDDVHPAEAGRDIHTAAAHPTRSWRSAITRSTATRCIPRTCRPLGGPHVPSWQPTPAGSAA